MGVVGDENYPFRQELEERYLSWMAYLMTAAAQPEWKFSGDIIHVIPNDREIASAACTGKALHYRVKVPQAMLLTAPGVKQLVKLFLSQRPEAGESL